MKKKWNRLKEIIRLFRLDMIFLIVGLYFALCFSIYLILRLEDMETPFWDVVCFNLLTVTGNDYIYVDSPWARVMGIFMLILGMFGLSSITGYVSSAFVARRLNPERGVKKMQTMTDHIIICGYKNDVKGLILGILRKNRNLSASDIILINNTDDGKMQVIRDDDELKGLNLLRGDFTEEQTLLKANVKRASKVLIIGEAQDNLDDELVDSRVFVAALLISKLNPNCHICAEIRTERYKNYLENQHCAEVVYVEGYTRYILSTSTNYSGMSKVMSSFLDDGDGISVQIAPIPEKWVGKTFGELFSWYKKEQNILLLGVLENMGVEKELKHQILSEAQKSMNYGEIIQNLKSVKTLETNRPHLNPGDDFVLSKNMGAIILGVEI
ncbi:MAG: NAD-binding protein [Lachnospiraceae bacterium]|nr:NAD-binding protein [Lachnospiraceae bacterium]